MLVHDWGTSGTALRASVREFAESSMWLWTMQTESAESQSGKADERVREL
jgi:hypothetical protein